MKIPNIVKLILLILAVNFYTNGFAQCNVYAKYKCMPKLKPYLNTEQLYSTTLLADDKAELFMTFYYGIDYRIIVCAQDVLGKIQFNLKDGNNNVVFTTKGYGSIMWDFNVENTQEFTIEVLTPSAQVTSTGEAVDKGGCLSIVVGSK